MNGVADILITGSSVAVLMWLGWRVELKQRQIRRRYNDPALRVGHLVKRYIEARGTLQQANFIVQIHETHPHLAELIKGTPCTLGDLDERGRQTVTCSACETTFVVTEQDITFECPHGVVPDESYGSVESEPTPYPIETSCRMCDDALDDADETLPLCGQHTIIEEHRRTREAKQAHEEALRQTQQAERRELTDKIAAWAAGAETMELATAMARRGTYEPAIYRWLLDPTHGDEVEADLHELATSTRHPSSAAFARALLAPTAVRKHRLVTHLMDECEHADLDALRDLARREEVR